MPYTGSGHLASALAMDKHLSKVVLRSAGVATANWIMAPAPDSAETLDADDVGRHLDWPVVVKPSKQGSTVGLSIVRAPEELAAAVREAFRYDDEVMIERFVPGRELTVGILGDAVLPTIEIQPVKELYDYECKYTPGMAKEFVAELSPEEASKLADQAKGRFRPSSCGVCAHRFPAGSPGAAVVSGSQHVAGNDTDESHSAGGGRSGRLVSRSV